MSSPFCVQAFTPQSPNPVVRRPRGHQVLAASPLRTTGMSPLRPHSHFGTQTPPLASSETAERRSRPRAPRPGKAPPRGTKEAARAPHSPARSGAAGVLPGRACAAPEPRPELPPARVPQPCGRQPQPERLSRSPLQPTPPLPLHKMAARPLRVPRVGGAPLPTSPESGLKLLSKVRCRAFVQVPLAFRAPVKVCLHCRTVFRIKRTTKQKGPTTARWFHSKRTCCLSSTIMEALNHPTPTAGNPKLSSDV
eukprot:XP_017447835.1 PREDICTED: vegetative cell wall protein gp1-like isoform X1 [Rattus norvegicus]